MSPGDNGIKGLPVISFLSVTSTYSMQYFLYLTTSHLQLAVGVYKKGELAWVVHCSISLSILTLMYCNTEETKAVNAAEDKIKKKVEHEIMLVAQFSNINNAANDVNRY